MFRQHHAIIGAIAICALTVTLAPCRAGTIIKLSLGGDAAADVEYTGGPGGVFSTADDLAVSTGDQNTSVEFLDFLDSATDITTPVASFTLDGLTAVGPATVIGGTLAIQNFAAGATIALYNAADVLLLSGTLSTATLTGTAGPPATGGLFTTGFSLVTGGSLAPYIIPSSLTLSMSLSDINGGTGFIIMPLPPPPPPPLPPGFSLGGLGPFTADASVTITGEFSGVPEPASVALGLLGIGGGLGIARRTRH